MARKKIVDVPPEQWLKWRGKPVCLVWLDAAFHENPDEIMPDPTMVLDFGLLDLYDETQVRIVGEFFADGGKRRVTAVPRQMVLRVIPWIGWKVADEFAKAYLKEETNAHGSAPANYYR